MSEESYLARMVSDVYKGNRATGNRIKSSLNAQVDPILQQLDKYKQSQPKRKTYTQNYFERMKQKEQRPAKKIIANKTNVFKESDPNQKPRAKKKIFYEYLTKTSPVMRQSSVKTYPTKLNQDKVGKLITQAEDTPTDTEVQHKKINPSRGNPSFDLKKANDRKRLLPCEVEDIYKKKYRRNALEHKSVNTNDRIFTEGRVETERSHNKLINSSNNFSSNLAGLIEYKFGPNFRDQIITEKPNRQALTRNSSRKIEPNFTYGNYRTKI